MKPHSDLPELDSVLDEEFKFEVGEVVLFGSTKVVIQERFYSPDTNHNHYTGEVKAPGEYSQVLLSRESEVSRPE